MVKARSAPKAREGPGVGFAVDWWFGWSSNGHGPLSPFAVGSRFNGQGPKRAEGARRAGRICVLSILTVQAAIVVAAVVDVAWLLPPLRRAGFGEPWSCPLCTLSPHD